MEEVEKLELEILKIISLSILQKKKKEGMLWREEVSSWTTIC